MQASERSERRLTLYRDDSTAQVVYDRVKTWFWTADNSVLVISRFDQPGGSAHHYVHWPRERFSWFRDEPAGAAWADRPSEAS